VIIKGTEVLEETDLVVLDDEKVLVKRQGVSTKAQDVNVAGVDHRVQQEDQVEIEQGLHETTTINQKMTNQEENEEVSRREDKKK
jgi:hypothetical protein